MPDDNLKTKCTAKYTVDASLTEGGKSLSPPFSAKASAEDELSRFEFYDLLVPASGKNDKETEPTTIVFPDAKPTKLPIPDTKDIYFLAVTPADSSSAKSQVFAVAAEDTAPTFTDVKVVAEGTPPGPRKPDDIVKDTRKMAAKVAADKLYFVMPEGGLVFAGPAARLLVKALGADQANLLIWNLTTTDARVGLVIGRFGTTEAATKATPGSLKSGTTKGDETSGKASSTGHASGKGPGH